MIVIRTPDQRLRISVSSTMKELASARAAARAAIERPPAESGGRNLTVEQVLELTAEWGCRFIRAKILR